MLPIRTFLLIAALGLGLTACDKGPVDGATGGFEGRFRCIVFTNSAVGASAVTRQFTLDTGGSYEVFDPTGKKSTSTGTYKLDKSSGFLDFPKGDLREVFARPRDTGGWYLTTVELRDATEHDQTARSEICDPA